MLGMSKVYERMGKKKGSLYSSITLLINSRSLTFSYAFCDISSLSTICLSSASFSSNLEVSKAAVMEPECLIP